MTVGEAVPNPKLIDSLINLKKIQVEIFRIVYR